MKNEKIFGWILLFLGAFFISPIPGPDDILGFKLYAYFSGIDLSISSFSAHYIDYLIFSSIIGFVLVFFGMKLLRLNFKGLLNKFGVERYKIALAISVLTLGLISYFNLNSLTSYSLVGLVAFFYYTNRKDKSEALAIVTAPLILLWFGFKDLLDLIIHKMPIPKVIESTNVVGWMSQQFGFSQVTNVSFLISIIIGFLILFLMTKTLKDKF